MDIDEFLDRELTDLNSGESSENSGNSEQPFKNQAPGALSADASSNLTKSNLEQAEHSYNQLWHALMQQNIKWNGDLYEQLSSLSRQFSGSLSKAFDETKNKAGRIYELTAKARTFLKEEKKDMALKVYSQAQELSNSVPSVFFQEKRALQEQVNSIYREIISATDAELIKKVSVILQEINQEIDKINFYIMSNNMENASAAYIKCIELYNSVPEGFLKDKNPAGIRLLGVYRSISINMEIMSLQKHLGQPQQFRQESKSPSQESRQDMPRRYEIRSEKPSAQISVKEISKPPVSEKYGLLSKKKEHAKRNIKKGFYNEAWKNIEEALQVDPSDVESKALRAKIKTLQ